MIYAVITAAGIVIATIGPWPDGSLDRCSAEAAKRPAMAPEVVAEHDLKFWCGEYAQRPELGAPLLPPAIDGKLEL
jgi:hypothetical protein